MGGMVGIFSQNPIYTIIVKYVLNLYKNAYQPYHLLLKPFVGRRYKMESNMKYALHLQPMPTTIMVDNPLIMCPLPSKNTPSLSLVSHG